MEFNLEELYEFANVSAPGGNHYTIEETKRVWNTEKGSLLTSMCNPDSFYQHFIMVHIYGAMAQRYSGVFDTKESYVLQENEKLKKLYEHLSKSIFPFGYKFYTIQKENGIQLVIQKEDEALENICAKVGIEYYSDIPDKVHRPPYYVKPCIVKENLTITLEEFKCKKKNEETMKIAYDKLYQFRHSIQEKNIQTFLTKIENYDRSNILDIVDYIYNNSEELDYEEDYQEYSEETLLNIIRFELEHSYYDWVRNIIMKF